MHEPNERGNMLITGRGIISRETWIDIVNLLNKDLLLPFVGKPENEIIVEAWMRQSALKNIPEDARIELVFPQKSTSPKGRVPLLEVYADTVGAGETHAPTMSGAGKEVW